MLEELRIEVEDETELPGSGEKRTGGPLRYVPGRSGDDDMLLDDVTPVWSRCCSVQHGGAAGLCGHGAHAPGAGSSGERDGRSRLDGATRRLGGRTRARHEAAAPERGQCACSNDVGKITCFLQHVRMSAYYAELVYDVRLRFMKLGVYS